MKIDKYKLDGCFLVSQKLRKVMVQKVVTVEPNATVKRAAELMKKHEIGCLIVVQGEKPVGIVTERDMINRVVNGSRDPQETRINAIMSEPLTTVAPSMRAGDAARLMLERNIKKLPVVENQRLVGLITLTDLIRCDGVVEFLNGLSLHGTSKRMKKVVSLYFDRAKRLRRRCPLSMKSGFSTGCQEKKCMWWLEDECAITKLSRQTEQKPMLSFT